MPDFMNRPLRLIFMLAVALASCSLVSAQATQPAADSGAASSASVSPASISPAFAKKIYEQVTPSLVGVQFTWEYEFGKADFVEPGVIVAADGTVMLPGADLLPRLPVEQLHDFKVIIPRHDKDNEELDAELLGRDARSDTVFVRIKEKRDWKPVHFEDVAMTIGEPVISVGLTARQAGYRSYLSEGIIGAYSRGEMPSYIATAGGLSNVAAPVFNSEGKAVGWVAAYPGTQFLLYTTFARRGDQIDPMAPIASPPHLFFPTSDFAQSLSDPPTAGQPQKLPWLGLPNLSGVDKDVAQVLGLENQPAVEIGDVIAGGPADKAGMKVGMKIVKMNGKPLERGDLPEELPAILHRRIICMPIGAKVTFTVMTEKDQPTKDVTVTLTERPIDSTLAKRYWAEDLGFGVRSLVFDDTYERKQPADMKGVIVTIIKQNSAAASAKLGRDDVITTLNGNPVIDIEEFQKDYKAFRQDKPKEAIVLVVMKRDASTQTIRIEPPQ